MSYQHYDHADWVARNIAAAKGSEPKRRSDNAKGWAAAPDTLNAFQAKVMDILGMVGGGIYNAPISWDAIQWRGWGSGIAVPWRRDLSTYDYDGLTKLVFLCHEGRIRCEIRPHSPGFLLLAFFPRDDSGGISRRHPNLAEAVAAFQEYLPADHRVRDSNLDTALSRSLIAEIRKRGEG